MLGCGTVGGAVLRLLDAHRAEIERRAGGPVEIVRVAVRDAGRDRGIDPALLTTDPRAVVDDPTVDLVVELMGGVEPARDLVLRALGNGKPVVTANKELLATEGRAVFDAAEAADRDLLFEAAVGGGIPLKIGRAHV